MFRSIVSYSVAAALLMCCNEVGRTQTPTEPDYGAELPRIAPLDPEQAKQSFELVDGFKIDLVASEPLVVDPIAFYLTLAVGYLLSR